MTLAGVFTIDAKRCAGRLQVRARGRQLWLAGWNRSKLLDRAHRQAEAVTAALSGAGIEDVPAMPVLCFADTELPRMLPTKQAGSAATAPLWSQLSI